jgi:hypothetical protein
MITPKLDWWRQEMDLDVPTSISGIGMDDGGVWCLALWHGWCLDGLGQQWSRMHHGTLDGRFLFMQIQRGLLREFLRAWSLSDQRAFVLLLRMEGGGREQRWKREKKKKAFVDRIVRIERGMLLIGENHKSGIELQSWFRTHTVL